MDYHSQKRVRYQINCLRWLWVTSRREQKSSTLRPPLQNEAREGHTIKGLQNNLYSINKLVQADYIPIFNKDTFDIYDAKNTIVIVSRRAVCRGYHDKRAQLWRLPLINKGGKEEWRTATTKSKPADILFNSPAPPTAYILNAYKIRAQPSLIRYYHTAAGFPTKLT